MTGAELLAYVKQHLNEQNVATYSGRDAEIYSAINLARQFVYHQIVDFCPHVIAVENIINKSTTPSWPFNEFSCFDLSSAAKILELRENDFDGVRLSRANQLGTDRGDYDLYQATVNPRTVFVRLAKKYSGVGTIWAKFIPNLTTLFPNAITGSTTEDQVGLPVMFHEPIALRAAITILSKNEEDDARITRLMFDELLQSALNTYSDIDPLGESTRFANEFARAQIFNYNDI